MKATDIGDYSGIKLPADIQKAEYLLNNIFKNDAFFRKRKITSAAGFEFEIFYIDGMVNSEIINESVIKPVLMQESKIQKTSVADFLMKKTLFNCEIETTDNLAVMLRSIIYGDTLLIAEGCDTGFIINSKGWPKRAIQEPENEKTLEGPCEGFIESAQANVALIRKKLISPDFSVELLRLGKRTDTKVFICYLGGLADKYKVELLKSKISSISIDGILDTNYLDEITSDKPDSFFKTAGTTQRPDIVAALLLEGRIAIITDGSPTVMTVPYLFSENFQSDEEYYIGYLLGSASRIMRYICFFLATSLPAIYIALTTFHNFMLPSSFAIAVMESRIGVPFSSMAECILLIIIFRMLIESGMRMPKNLSTALSIVGGIVIGQSAVDAKIVSATALITIAMSGIAGLMVPKLNSATFYLRLIFIFSSYFLGFFGLLAAWLTVLTYILGLTSLETDCTISLTEISFYSLKDSFFRASWKKMRTRPAFSKDLIRKR